MSLWNRQPRALDFPAQINDPGPGADFALDYRNALRPRKPGVRRGGRIHPTYLTATNGLDRYVVAGALPPDRRLQSAVVSSAATSRSVPEAPAPETIACAGHSRRPNLAVCHSESGVPADAGK